MVTSVHCYQYSCKVAIGNQYPWPVARDYHYLWNVAIGDQYSWKVASGYQDARDYQSPWQIVSC